MGTDISELPENFHELKSLRTLIVRKKLYNVITKSLNKTMPLCNIITSGE
jgi:hypothetical protein